jgi:hypothetical protein
MTCQRCGQDEGAHVNFAPIRLADGTPLLVCPTALFLADEPDTSAAEDKAKAKARRDRDEGV